MDDITNDQWLAAASRQSHYLSVERFNEHVNEISLRLNKPREEVLVAIGNANQALFNYGEPWKWAYATLEVLRSLHIGDTTAAFAAPVSVSDQDIKTFGPMLRALSGGRQLLILRYLVEQEQPTTVGQLAKALDYVSSAIQESLDILTDQGVLTFDRTGGVNYYRVNADPNVPSVVGRLLDALFYGAKR
jgi:DNA-binding transcriptional ArsR family regulator